MQSKILSIIFCSIMASSCTQTPKRNTSSERTHTFCTEKKVKSVGNYWDGLIYNSCNLQDELASSPISGKFVFASNRKYQFGHAFTAHVLLQSAFFLNSNYPDKVIMIGDISKQGGGRLFRHETHQTGLDVDIAYLPMRAGANGHRTRSMSNRFPENFVINKHLSSNFDVEANFHLMRFLIKTFDVYVFTDQRIINAFKMLDMDSETLTEVLDMMEHNNHHTDHFHIKVPCPKADQLCKNEWRKRDELQKNRIKWKPEYQNQRGT